MYKGRVGVAFKEIWQMKAERQMEAMNSWRFEMLQEYVVGEGPPGHPQEAYNWMHDNGCC
jgi:hypothetical protein